MGSGGGGGFFNASGDAYDGFMGRYSQPLASVFADAVGVTAGQAVLDVGCGPGALTSELVVRLGPDLVRACDPSRSFVAECARRHPGVEARVGRAEAIPYADSRFDVVLAQLVLHFVDDPPRAAEEFRRVVRPGGVVAACVWDFAEGMQMLRHFWDAALTVDPDAPDEARTMRFGRQGEIAGLLGRAAFVDVGEARLEVASFYRGFDELWGGFLAGIGPAGSYCVALSADAREAVRAELFARVGSPTSGFGLTATARCSWGTRAS